MTLLPPSFHFHTPTTTSSSSSSTSSPLPPPQSSLLITSTPQSPADFLIYSLLASSIRQQQQHKAEDDDGHAYGGGTLVVDFQARGRGHYESVGRKIGTPLPPKQSTSGSSSSSSSSSSFEYYAPSPSDLFPTDDDDDPSSSSSSPKAPLKTLYDRITQSIPSTPTSTQPTDANQARPARGRVIFLVGFSELGWMGFGAEELGRFHRALMGFVRKSQSTLITQLHAPLLLSPQLTADYLASPSFVGEEDVELGLLLRLLRAGSAGGGTIWWRVEELKSGRSGVVHGEISIHPLSPKATKIQQRVFYQNPLQYRLDDTAVRVFPKGTGRGYL